MPKNKQSADYRTWIPTPLAEKLLAKQLFVGEVKRRDGSTKKALMSKDELIRVRESNRKRNTI